MFLISYPNILPKDPKGPPFCLASVYIRNNNKSLLKLSFWKLFTIALSLHFDWILHQIHGIVWNHGSKYDWHHMPCFDLFMSTPTLSVIIFQSGGLFENYFNLFLYLGLCWSIRWCGFALSVVALTCGCIYIYIYMHIFLNYDHVDSLDIPFVFHLQPNNGDNEMQHLFLPFLLHWFAL